MTRETQLRVRHRAMRRRAGEWVDLDREEGQVIAEQFRAGLAVEEIASLHGLARMRVHRRLYTMGVYREGRP